jgi:hypothetical protein
VAFVVMAALVWWRCRADGVFYIIGIGGEMSATLGPIFPGICAGLTIAVALLMVDTAVGPVAGVLAAVCIAALPGFMPLHRESLLGPPLLSITVLILGVMLHAPRFSLAYGSLAAMAAVFVSPAGVGFPAAAVAWPLSQPHRPSGSIKRAILAIVPLGIVVVLSRFVGDEWPAHTTIVWRGGLDRGLQAAGTIIGNQVTPLIHNPAVRFFALADLALLVVALVLLAWLRVVRAKPEDALVRRLFAAAGVLSLAYAVGLAVRTLIIAETPPPDLVAVLPLVVVSVLVIVTSLAVFWPRWNRWSKLVVVVLLAGWLQAALRA